MQTINITFDEVDLPLTQETIQQLGKEHGTSMFITRVYEEFKDYTSITTYILKIFKTFSDKWNGTLDGRYIYKESNSKIIEIAKFSFNNGKIF